MLYFLRRYLKLISKEKLIKTLIKGRYECYVKKSSLYNPYKKSEVYDWDFKLETDDLLFTDSYRGVNPYSGVEYVYEKGISIPVWSCDYVGFVNQDTDVSAQEIYNFLKKARGKHIINCGKDLFSEYRFKDGSFEYETAFQGDINALLQIEYFYYKGIKVAQQIAAGRLKNPKE
jgi:hypothetical protein